VVTAWFEDPDTAAVDRLLDDVAPTRAWAPVEDIDWEARWRASFQPIQVSPRLLVAPPWDAPDNALIIEPGLGFGSGTHPTTRSALVAVDALADGLQTALDVGCGSGILGIAAAKLGMEVEGIDVDEPSVRNAIYNAELNAVSATWSTQPVQQLTTARDLVLGNLHAELIAALATDLVRLTGHWLVLAGILVEREHLVREAIDPHLHLHLRSVDGEWVGLRYRRGA
jgi:ribosomal protein L11 methyltransferase